jgi:hypothetical protein
MLVARGDVPGARLSLPDNTPRLWIRPQLNSGTLGARESTAILDGKNRLKMRELMATVMVIALISCGSSGGAGSVSDSGSLGGSDSALAGMGGGGGDLALAGTGGEGDGDAGLECFPCQGYWICGGSIERIDLLSEADGCFLSGLPGRNVLSTDGTITANGVLVGTAKGSGARVHVAYPDGSQWLYCVGGGGPCL